MYLLWWLCIHSSGPKLKRDLYSAKMHFSSKSGNPTLTSEWVIKFNGLSRTADSEVHYLEEVVIYYIGKLKMGYILTFKLYLTLKVKVNIPIKKK